ncbi:DNA translocase FtsK 4TM domain-containing protein [Psychrobacter sp.]|uniref:DNA translocase FtsK 4TM domain-containing protein n=1 Tax=Psychrobacter sp. TaxID=56811 RepID=UPI003F988812
MISAALIEYLKKGIFTLLGLILAVYLFVILITYTGNDPSWSHISSDMTTINNMGGATGAWLSDLLYGFFGFGAWWLLVFIVYESVLIWWDNKPTLWLMRFVAYIFLLLSGSALFAQMVALVQQVADPVTTELEGVAGGIIGLELQARLAQLLSQWGSVLFLLVFVVVTATFAFNIHWLTMYKKVIALSWFGSGVKANAAKYDDSATSSNDAAAEYDRVDVADTHKTSDYEQLPLELQSAETSSSTSAVDDSGRFGNVLSDFLSSSGLADSVKASVAAATQAAMSNNEKNEHVDAAVVPSNGNDDKASKAPEASSSINPTTQPSRKVEPSFSWNDEHTVDDLLASEQMADSASHTGTLAETREEEVSAPQTPITNPVSTASPVSTDGSQEHQTSVEDLPSSESVTPATADTVSADISSADINDTTQTVDKSVDTLAGEWLAEHTTAESISVDATDHVVTESNNVALNPELSETEDSVHTDKLSQSAAPSDVESRFVDKPSVQAVDTEQPASSSVSEAAAKPETQPQSTEAIAEMADMTPTNTPPADPKAAPTPDSAASISPNSSVNAKAATSQAASADTPTVSFAVPEGDSGNHITDMMPDDDGTSDETAKPVMPDISDDAAFSQKSRSMQTAAYRDSLTPIPELSILDKPDPDRKPSYTPAELEQLSELLEIKLQEFNVKATVVNAIPGPVVTRFEVELAAGVKASKVTGISRDLARSLSMASLRVVEVIPGKPYIGIEVPNKKREMVRLIELLNTDTYKDPKAQISMAMGKDIGDNPVITDLARAPHMLVAGTTGSGKSVLVNSMLLSMLLKYTPNDLRLILIDPKQLELANYNDIPHLLTPVVTDMTEAASSLSWCVAEMERRYQLMSLLKVRKLNEFNKKVIAAEASGNPMLDPLWRPNDSVSVSQAPKLKTLPMIVIVADEFADMIMQVGKQAEELITRLAQKSRAAGIHLMLATQRPSVDVITGLIKANIPVRAALRVNSKVDSRTILDSGGAEDMLGNGDMMFLGPGQIEPDRVHGAYVSDEEVNRVCDAWRERGAPDYIDNMAGNFELSSPGGGSTGSSSGEDDDLYDDAVAFIMETRKVSASSIQRKFSIGYNRAARIVDSMEEAGLVSSMGKSGKRELLM